MTTRHLSPNLRNFQLLFICQILKPKDTKEESVASFKYLVLKKGFQREHISTQASLKSLLSFCC